MTLSKVPEFASAEILMNHLGMSLSEANFIRRFPGYKYQVIPIPKKSGGVRFLRVPDSRLKHFQKKLLLLLEKIYVPRNPAHGFISGRSCITNAERHQGRPFALNLDIENFFGSITARRIKGLFEALDIPDDTVQLLLTLVTVSDQLPQGAPTSPILSNMVCFRLDRRFQEFCKAHHYRYTRYADDITISSFRPPAELFEDGKIVSGLVPLDAIALDIRLIINGNGFQVNPRKAWFSSRRDRKEVTGLIVNRFPNVPRTYVRNIRAALHKVETAGVSAAQADYESHYAGTSSLEHVLAGRLNWLAQVRGYSFEPYRRLAAKFNRLYSSSQLRIDPSTDELIRGSVWAYEWITDTADGVECGQGSAIFIKGVGLVTAYHAVKDLPAGAEIELVSPFAFGKTFSATRTGRECEFRDLAVLNHNVPDENHHELIPSTSDEPVGSATKAVGYPAYAPGDSLTAKDGQITSRLIRHAVHCYEVSQILSSGMSGGPVLNDRSEVLGIIKSGGASEDRQICVSIQELDGI